MRFKYDSYEKLFPRHEIPQPDQYETVVESFTPSKDGTQDAPAAPAPAAAAPIPEPIKEGNTDGNTNDN